MRRIAVLVSGLLLLTAAPPIASAKTSEKTTTSKLAFALWTTHQDLAPNVQRITNWYVEISSGDGAHSQLYYERTLCEDHTGQTPCVTVERRDGTSRRQGRRFTVSRDLKRASLDATFDLQRSIAPGIPVGTPEPVRIRTSWTAIDAPERAHGVTSYEGRCAFRQTVRETGIKQRAVGTIDGAKLGGTTEARIVRSVVEEERAAC